MLAHGSSLSVRSVAQLVLHPRVNDKEGAFGKCKLQVSHLSGFAVQHQKVIFLKTCHLSLKNTGIRKQLMIIILRTVIAYVEIKMDNFYLSHA